MKFYWNCIKINLESQMQYKLSFFLTLFGQFITAFTTFFGIQFIFLYMDAVGGFTKEQVYICFAVVMMSFAIGEMFGAGLASFPRIIGNGEFDRALVRPRNIILQVLTQHVDFTRLGLLVQSILVLCYAIPKSGITWSPYKVITICLMILCGSAVFFGLFLFKASIAFFTLQDLNFLNVLTYGARKFGRFPVSVYGDGILKVLTYVVPMSLFQYYPLLYLFDRRTERIYLFFPLLSLLFLIPCYGLYRFGVRKFQSTGS